MDDIEAELADAIWMLAELSTSAETPGVASDELMDQLILAARQVMHRNNRHALKQPSA